MVPRFRPNGLSRPVVLFCLLLAAVPGAWADPGSPGAEAFKHFQDTVAKQTAAMAQQDMTAYETLDIEATSALRKAESAYADAFRSTGDEDSALGYIAVLREKGDDDLGAEVARQALDQGLDSAALWRSYGSCLLVSGAADRQAGIDALYTSLDRDKESPGAVATWNELGSYYLDTGMAEAASKAFTEALALDATDTRARLGALVVAVYDGDVAKAGTILSEVGRAAQPYDTQLRAQLRIALDDFDGYRKSFSDTAENHYAYARLLYSAARLPQAILAVSRATTLAPNDTAIWNFLGALQLQLGDYPSAQKSYESSLRANSEQSDIQQTVEKLKEAQQEAAQKATTGGGKGPLR